MSEELRKRNHEINDAALEQVSGGIRSEVEQACASCPTHMSRTGSPRCTFEGGIEKLAEYVSMKGIYNFKFNRCPFFKY